jgi:hypothetical protein
MLRSRSADIVEKLDFGPRLETAMNAAVACLSRRR